MSEFKEFRRKPVQVRAAQWFCLEDLSEIVKPYPDGDGLCGHCGGELKYHGWVGTSEDGYLVCPGDWIVEEVDGQYYPCRPEVFDKAYFKDYDDGTEVRQKIVCLDFDGVLHYYRNGWKGVDNVYDEPVPGAVEFVKELVKYFQVAVFSCRNRDEDGVKAMKGWMQKHGFPVDEIEFPVNKPPAWITIDDRAIQFKGEWPSIEFIDNFSSWVNRSGDKINSDQD